MTTGGKGGVSSSGASGTSTINVGGGTMMGGASGTTGTGGATSGTGGGTTAGSSGGAAPPVGGELSSCATPGPRLIQRLSSIQYRNTLIDAFGSGDVPTADVLTDPSVMKFRVDADAPVVRDLDAGLLMNYAETVAAWAVTTVLGNLVSCNTNDTTCRSTLIKTLGLKLFREPLSDAQVTTYDTLASTETSFNDAAAQIIGTMLQSPYLLYRRELGTVSASDPNSYDLSAYEVASELAYFLTDSAPDATLLGAAADGSILTQAGLDAQAERLLFTLGAKATVSRFASGWFELDGLANKAKDDTVFALTPELRQSMISESQEFFAHNFAYGGDVTALLTSPMTLIDQGLVTFYGVTVAPDKDGWRDLTGTQRAPGMLGQAAFLTAHAQPENSSPVQRGRFVRDRLLCEPIQPMPSNLNTNLAAPAGFTTNRERYSEHDKNPQCSGCHIHFDPVGFSLEHFDGFGRYRDQENGVAIDATGTVFDEPTGDIPLDGAQSLIDYLSTSDQVRACLVRYWSYYAHGRDNWTDKKCNDDAIRREAEQNGYTLYSVFSAILHAQTFAHRVKDQ